MNQNVDHSAALIRKAILIFPVVWIVLSAINGVSFIHSTLLGIVLLLLSYFTGDLMILPKSGNMVATLSDLGLSFIVIWGGLNLLGYDNAAGEAFLTAVVVTLGEYFFHLWMERTQFDQPTHVRKY